VSFAATHSYAATHNSAMARRTFKAAHPWPACCARRTAEMTVELARERPAEHAQRDGGAQPLCAATLIRAYRRHMHAPL